MPSVSSATATAVRSITPLIDVVLGNNGTEAEFREGPTN